MKKAILTIALFFLSLTLVSAQEEKVTIYVREGCPHCAKVEDFVSSNDLESQVTYVETFNNPENQAQMDAAFNDLNVPASSRGVPFMVYADGTDYEIGDTPIIAYLAEKNNIEVVEPEYQTATADYLFLGLGGLFVLGILGYGIYTVFVSKDN